MEVVMGAVGSLLPKLGRLLMDEYKLQNQVKEDVESLVREMKSMHAALSKVAEVPWYELDDQVKLWADNVRELSYDMEDVVDNFLVCAEASDDLSTNSSSSKIKELMQNMVKLFTEGKIRHQIADAIRDIRSRAQEVADLRAKYKVDDAVANVASKVVVDPRLLALYKDQKEIIGIEDPRRKLTEMLGGGDDGDGVSRQQLKTVSIYGFGGLGKTTLAKATYDSLEPRFDCSAFVSVGRNPDVKKVFKDIVLEIKRKVRYMGDVDLTIFDEKQLIDRLRWVLQNVRRYFIVIDDIWDLETWKILKCALVDNNRGSRIITTTRIQEVASNTGDVYKLEPLSNDLSEKLFYTRLFGGKDKCPYDLPVEVTDKILRKCGGVPLAIITISSLLVGKAMEDWSKIYNAIGFRVNEDNRDVENMRKILSFSFYDLPCHLRTCLLQLCIFPEDCLILKDAVIWKWIAEGFVIEEPGVGLFEMGERYFNELINRSMIQPVEEPDRYTIYACRIHDMVLDMICLLSQKQNFIKILDSSKDDHHKSSHSSARWLAVQKRTSEQQDPLAYVRMPKLRSFCATMCDISKMSSFSKFQVLRVLVLHDCSFMKDRPYHLKHLGKLLQLRYLGLENTPIHELPEDVGNLQLLQTLDLKGSRIESLPESVGLLKRLKRMRADCCGSMIRGGTFVGVLAWLGNLSSLEELYLLNTGVASIFVEQVSKLTELRVLSIWINEFDQSSKKAFVESLCNLHKLQVLSLGGGGWSIRDAQTCWKSFVPPRQLRDLLISATFRRLPAWVNPCFLPNLTNLSMTVCSLEARDVETLGRFPELVSMDLNKSLDISITDVPLAMPGDSFRDGAFLKLRSCYMRAPFRFEEGAMPSIESLKFEVEVKTMDDDDDFDLSSLGNLPCLKKVQVSIACRYARARDVEEVEASVRQAAEVHPNRPVLVLTKSDEDQVIYDEDAWNYAQSDMTRGFTPSTFLEHQYAWNLLATRNKQRHEAAAAARLAAETKGTSSAAHQVIDDEPESDSESDQADQQQNRVTTEHGEATVCVSSPPAPVPARRTWRCWACFGSCPGRCT